MDIIINRKNTTTHHVIHLKVLQEIHQVVRQVVHQVVHQEVHQDVPQTVHQMGIPYHVHVHLLVKNVVIIYCHVL
jgi:hypothetical protein